MLALRLTAIKGLSPNSTRKSEQLPHPPSFPAGSPLAISVAPPPPALHGLVRPLALGQRYCQPVDGPHPFLHQKDLLVQLITVVLVQILPTFNPLPEIYHLP